MRIAKHQCIPTSCQTKKNLSPNMRQYHDQVDTKLFNIDIKLICEKRHINTEVLTYLTRIHDRHHLHNNHLHSLSTIHIMIISLGLRHKFFFFFKLLKFRKSCLRCKSLISSHLEGRTVKSDTVWIYDTQFFIEGKYDLSLKFCLFY